MKGFKILLIVILSVITVLLAAGLWFGMERYTGNNAIGEVSYTASGLGAHSLQRRTELDASGIDELEIDFGRTGYAIEILPGQGEKIILEEYAPFKAEDEYLAQLKQEDGRLVINGYRDQQGRTGFDWKTSLRNVFSFGFGDLGGVRLYVPEGFFSQLHALKISAGSGDITASFLQASTAEISTGSGHIEIKTGIGNFAVTAGSGAVEIGESEGDFLITTGSGGIRMGEHVGNLTLTSGSGGKEIESCTGMLKASSGSGKTEVKALLGGAEIISGSGSIFLNVEELGGDITLEGSSGSAKLFLPENASFTFEASAASGSIRTDFDNSLYYNRKGKAAEGTVGSNPLYSINCKFGSGNVRVSY